MAMAPEVLGTLLDPKTTLCTPAIDVWGAACFLYCLLARGVRLFGLNQDITTTTATATTTTGTATATTTMGTATAAATASTEKAHEKAAQEVFGNFNMADLDKLMADLSGQAATSQAPQAEGSQDDDSTDDAIVKQQHLTWVSFYFNCIVWRL